MIGNSEDTGSGWIDPDDAPELTAAWFEKATLKVGGRPVGRPRGSDKSQVTLRLDRDVVDKFRADGAGWQTRINAALRKSLGL